MESDKTQQTIEKKIGKTGKYINRIVKKNNGGVNNTIIQRMEGLGYDVELTYVKREEK